MLPEYPGGKWNVSLYERCTVVSLELNEDGVIFTPTYTIPRTEDPEAIVRAAHYLLAELDQLRASVGSEFELLERQKRLRKKLGLL